MKKLVKRFIIIPILLFCICGYAQNDQVVIIGLKNNQFPFIGYCYNKQWNVTIMNSLFIRELDAQYIRFSGGYTNQLNEDKTSFTIQPYFGLNYGFAYYDIGLQLKVQRLWFSKLETSAEFIPFYDTSQGFHLGYLGSIGYKLNKNVSTIVKLSNYPEFRIPANRISLGFMFDSYPLVIKPELSVPIKGDLRTSHILISFLYVFTIRGNSIHPRTHRHIYF